VSPHAVETEPSHKNHVDQENLLAAIAVMTKSARDLFLSPYSIRAQLARNSVWALVGSAFSQGSTMLAAFVLARGLGLTRFGQLALILATVLLLGNLGEAGLTLTTAKFTGQWRTSDPDRAGRLIGCSLRMTAISAIFMVFLLAVIGPQIGHLGSGPLSKEVLAGAGLLAFDMLNRVQFGALAGLEAFAGTARINLWRGLLTLPCVWLGIRIGDLPGAILAMAVVSLVTFVIGHLVLRKQCIARSIRLGYRASLENGILTTSGALWISSLLLTGSAWLANLLLSRHSGGVAQLGIFNAASRWNTALLFLPGVLFQVVLPMLSHKRAEEDYHSCGRLISAVLAINILVTGVGALLIVFFSPVLMNWYGSEFRGGSSVLSLAALGAAVTAVYMVGSGALWGMGKPTQMLGVDIFRASLFMGLCLLGLASSAWNVMLAYLVSFSAGSAILMFYLYRELRFQSAKNYASDS
jgi:O-antigen/teichoic acid export membrane protein